MVDFAALRNRKGTNFDALQKSLEKSSSGGGFKKDERIWKPAEGKDGKTACIVRFLPIAAVDFDLVQQGKFKEEDLTPLIKVLKHQFQGPNGWYVENCLQTFGEPCPVREHDGPLWAAWAKKGKPAGSEKDIMVKRIAKGIEYVGVYVIKDSTNPENNGGVFLYEVPATIKKMIDAANKPEFENQVAFDPFDVWEGRDLILNIVYEDKEIGGKKARVPNWKNVTWAAQASALLDGNEKEIEAVWRKQHSLLEFHDRSKFKTFEELKTKFCKVMNLDENYNPVVGSAARAGTSAGDFVGGQASAPAPAPAAAAQAPAAAPAQAAQAAAPAAAPAASPAVGDAMAEFEALLNG